MALLTVLFILIGSALGGESGMVMAFFFAIAMNFGAYFFSDKLVLRMYKAQEIQHNDNPQLFQMVTEMTMKANLPMPKLYIIPSEQPNAFAKEETASFSSCRNAGNIEYAFQEELRE